MDAYRHVIVKLYEETKGSPKVIAHLSELIKREGFGGAMVEVMAFLNSEAWIADEDRVGFARITPRGIAEAKRILKGEKSPQDMLQDSVALAQNMLKHARLVVNRLEEHAEAVQAGKEKKASDLLEAAEQELNNLHKLMR